MNQLDHFYCYTFTCFDEDRASEWFDVMKHSGADVYEIKDYLANTLIDHRLEIRKHLEKIKQEVKPDIVFTHSHQCRHPDHKVLSEEVNQTFRYYTVLGYCGVKDGARFTPNVFVELTEADLKHKLEAIKLFKIEGSYQGFMSPEIVTARALIYGQQINVKYAEGFTVERMKLT